MNILAATYNWLHNKAGGETYMFNLLKALQALGHEIKVVANVPDAYTEQGIEVYPMLDMQFMFSHNNDLAKWADVIFYQLLANAWGYNKANQHQKTAVFFAHNSSKHYFVDKSYVVYNSHFLANKKLFDRPSTILQPIIPSAQQVKKGTNIALINCNYNKGGHVLVELAKLLPKEQFIGIEGYGEQVRAELPNLIYLPHTPEIDWSDIKLILCPSEFESWCQVASEAIVRGIPVICSDIAPLHENLSYAGIYLDRNEAAKWAETIRTLDYKSQRKLCLQRASEYDNENRVKEFEKWLVDIVIK